MVMVYDKDSNPVVVAEGRRRTGRKRKIFEPCPHRPHLFGRAEKTKEVRQQDRGNDHRGCSPNCVECHPQLDPNYREREKRFAGMQIILYLEDPMHDLYRR